MNSENSDKMNKDNPEIEDWRELVKNAILAEESFLHATFSRKSATDETPWTKIVIRPVSIKNRKHLQFSYFDARKDISKNYPMEEAPAKLHEALLIDFQHAHVQSSTGDLHIRMTRKGKPLVTKGKPSRSETTAPLEHNRPKHYLLVSNEPDLFLQSIGIMDQSGRIIPTMQAKYHQINEFLRIIEQVIPQNRENSLRVLDCGSGSAWLTFSAYHYLTQVRNLPVHMDGIDANPEVIQKSLQLRDRLGWTELDFRVSSIRDYLPDAVPDMVLSLHACDSATDEAIALGIRHGSPVILAAPCCQHELHNQLDADLFRPVLRHGILRERLADLLTDAIRALVLRIMGYQTSVMEFIAPAHTLKNLMIRAVRSTEVGDRVFIEEYLALKRYWKVEPILETLVGEKLQRLIRSSES